MAGTWGRPSGPAAREVQREIDLLASFCACEESYYPRQLQGVVYLFADLFMQWFGLRCTQRKKGEMAAATVRPLAAADASAPCYFLLKTWHANALHYALRMALASEIICPLEKPEGCAL